MDVVRRREHAKLQGRINADDTVAAATMFLGMVQGLVTEAMAADDYTMMHPTSSGLFERYLVGLRVAK